jgi:hypothetical protein
MPPADKPRHRSGYSTEETLQVESACLTVAVTLGAYLADLCIVGRRHQPPRPVTGG